MSKDTIYREDAMALVNKPVCPTGNSDYDEGKENEREAIKESLIALPSAGRPQDREQFGKTEQVGNSDRFGKE